MSMNSYEGWDDWCHVDPNEPYDDGLLDDTLDGDDDDDDDDDSEVVRSDTPYYDDDDDDDDD